MAIATLPGLIDPHVHLRDPGQTWKEDFTTGTAAAIAGGYTTVIDMPNNVQLIDNEQKLNEKLHDAKKKVLCDVGFYFGSVGNNLDQFVIVEKKVKGLKLFLNQTTGGYNITADTARKVMQAWPKEKVIMVHAEGEMLDFIIQVCREQKNKVHVCHVSTKVDLRKILDVKNEGLHISCGVTPHHLFLTAEEVKKLGAFGMVKPAIGTKEDQQFLWENLKDIDVVESDHAPHTFEEKLSVEPPFGVAELETALPLLLTAVSNGKLTLNDVRRLCFENPKRIFEIETSDDTYIEIDDSQWSIENSQLFTKSKWSPFNGWKVKGKVIKTVIRGTTVFKDGTILVEPGFGKVI